MPLNPKEQRPIHTVSIPPSIWQSAAQETKDRILTRELDEGFKIAKRELEYLQEYLPVGLKLYIISERRNDCTLNFYLHLEEA